MIDDILEWYLGIELLGIVLEAVWIWVLIDIGFMVILI